MYDAPCPFCSLVYIIPKVAVSIDIFKEGCVDLEDKVRAAARAVISRLQTRLGNFGAEDMAVSVFIWLL